MTADPLPATRLVVDPWDPGYASMAETGLAAPLDESDAPVALDIEVPASDWHAIRPASSSGADRVLFTDGVRRIEARVWFVSPSGQADPGIAASYAAGVVVCDGTAEVTSIEVERGLFSASPLARDVHLPSGDVFRARMASDNAIEVLSGALQERMRATEIAVAAATRAAHGPDDLLVVDGPLRGRENLPRTVGYIKTHQKAYLPADQQGVVASLQVAERSPVFTLGGLWSRHTWYLRLPGPIAHPWAGIVRVECSADLQPAAAVELANVTAATLPKFASHGHKDGRAPQNLYPIAGLERVLRHRLGDRLVMYRQLSAVS